MMSLVDSAQNFMCNAQILRGKNRPLTSMPYAPFQAIMSKKSVPISFWIPKETVIIQTSKNAQSDEQRAQIR